MIGHESTLYALKQCMCERDYQESYLSLKPQTPFMGNLFSKNEKEHPTHQELRYVPMMA